MIRTSTKSVLIIATVVCIAVGAVLAWTLVELQKKSAELLEQVDVIGESRAQIEGYTRLTSLLAATKTERETLLDFILHEDDIIIFLTELEQVGRSLGLTVATRELQTAPPAAGSAFSTLTVVIGFQGNRESAAQFLTLTESLPYGRHVEQFSFTQNQQEAGSRIVEGALMLLLPIQTYE